MTATLGFLLRYPTPQALGPLTSPPSRSGGCAGDREGRRAPLCIPRDALRAGASAASVKTPVTRYPQLRFKDRLHGSCRSRPRRGAGSVSRTPSSSQYEPPPRASPPPRRRAGPGPATPSRGWSRVRPGTGRPPEPAPLPPPRFTSSLSPQAGVTTPPAGTCATPCLPPAAHPLLGHPTARRPPPSPFCLGGGARAGRASPAAPLRGGGGQRGGRAATARPRPRLRKGRRPRPAGAGRARRRHLRWRSRRAGGS